MGRTEVALRPETHRRTVWINLIQIFPFSCSRAPPHPSFRGRRTPTVVTSSKATIERWKGESW